ncbi:fungal-specific transcription factor domain-containing protein [Ilyonectria sp. MPI-CAGE-AT-0026]|nr:fungal-specific transcription factor domain-containing protein [Ilyonectria sp. MPI-CAGE-AT-0026]
MTDSKPCWTCLKRRLVCDFGRPGCWKCAARNAECPGYGKKPLKWLAPGQTRSKGRRARDESNVIRLCLTDSSEASTLFEAIEYYNIRICPDQVATGCGGHPKSPFYIPIADAPNLPANIRYTVISIALAHRIIQSEESFESDRAALSAKLQSHRGSAIRHLAIQLKTASQAREVTLASVLVFLFAEIQHTLSPNWCYHCDAVYAVIDMLGGMSNTVLSQPLFQHLMRYFILVEIMGSTTAPRVEPERILRQLELISLLPSLYGNGLSTSLPCPPDLLSDIISINYLRSELGPVLSRGNDVKTAALNILKRVESFSAEKWIRDINQHEQRQVCDDKALQEQIGTWDWQSIAQIFQSAVALYCVSSLLGVDKVSTELQGDVSGDAGLDFHIATLQSTYLDVLLRNLKDIASSPKSQLRKLVFWPLVIGGIHVNASDNESKEFILGELTWVSKALGIASPLVAKDLLRKIWISLRRSKGNRHQCWGSLFDRPYVFAM